MANYYYLVASLPMLHFDMKPPFSFEVFLERCRQFLSGADYSAISSLPETKDAAPDEIRNNAVKRWLGFDALLRNELVKIRAHHKHVEPSKYLRSDGYAGQIIPHIALTAHRNTSILEAERFLDKARWDALTELEGGHYFDTDFLIIYGYKLKIIERWEKIRLADKEALLERSLKDA